MGSNHSTETTWFRAAAEGDQETLQKLADADMNVNVKDARGKTALIIAAGEGHAACVLQLIRRGCKLNVQDARGWTAAMNAAAEGKERCLRLVAEAGADLCVHDFLGTTPLMRAAIGGHAGCLRVLVEHGEDALELHDRMGMTAEQHALVKGHKDCARILRGAKRKRNGSSPSGSSGGSCTLKKRSKPKVRVDSPRRPVAAPRFEEADVPRSEQGLGHGTKQTIHDDPVESLEVTGPNALNHRACSGSNSELPLKLLRGEVLEYARKGEGQLDRPFLPWPLFHDRERDCDLLLSRRLLLMAPLMVVR